MPKNILPYLKGIIQGHRITATFLQHQFGYSHDKLTRILQKQFMWEHFLLLVVQKLFGILEGGYLIIDDTAIAKPHAKKLEGASFVHCSSMDKRVYGYQVVVLCWSNSSITIPLSWRWYKEHGKSKVSLAQDLLVEARAQWQIEPEWVLFDSYYSADRLLNQLERNGWKFVCRIKKNRIISCAPIKENLLNGESLVNLVTGLARCLIVRRDDKFYCTNAVELNPSRVLELYRDRWQIEEVFRFLKNQLHLQACQARTRIAQENHLAACMMVYLLVQKEQMGNQRSLYAIKWDWMLNRRQGENRLRHYSAVCTN